MIRRAAILLAFAPLAGAAEQPVVFNRDILPLLSENCFYCHGPDGKHREAGLRLDMQESAFRTKDGVTVIKPGDPDHSELVKRLTASDPDELMPPAKANRTLSPQQIALLRRWVAEGAPWGRHWAFEPVTKPSPPQPGHPIDAFIGDRLEHEGLTFSPEAPRAALLRRAALDLTGLPPTPEEAAAFVANPAPDAWEKEIDRLLASPAFGERMAWDWLDAARYADSNGYQGDADRTMWPWRDWVVAAFNRNLPFDQFTVWQLAGDLLPGATEEQRLATGFCRNHPINGEGGRIAEENRVDYVMDMAETTGTVWLGLTFNCCRCHDHKYDPLTRRDYYRLFAFFNRTSVDGGGGNPQTPPVLSAGSAEQLAQARRLEADIAVAESVMNARRQEREGDRPAWEQLRLGEAPVWTLLKPSQLSAEHQTLTADAENRILAAGPNPANDTYTLTFPADLPEIAALRLEALRHPSMTNGALGRSDSGNFVLTEIEATIQRPGVAVPERLTIQSAEATYEQNGLPVKNAFDGLAKTGWAVHEGRPVDREHAAVFRFAKPVSAGPGSVLTVILRHDSGHVSHNLGFFRLAAALSPVAALREQGDGLRVALRTPESTRTGDQRNIIAEAFLAADKPWSEARARRDQLRDQLKKAKDSWPKVMVMEDVAAPRKTFMLDRGIYTKPGDEVTAGVPESFPPLPDKVTVDRLALARWLVSPEQPLTARVVVNRFWQLIFGTGLVRTPEDFGVQSEVPAQLDLLNWLAADFRDSGWNTKALLRLILTSRTYRQSSKVTPELLARDPANRFFARSPRYRMPSWMLRDQALAVSGLLVRKTGGPPVNTWQPDGVWEEATFGIRKYTRDRGESLYRRSLYTFWRRISAPTGFFDNSARQVCTVKALRTNTPLHALTTLNDTTFVEAARVFAARLLTAGLPDDNARISLAWSMLLLREPSPREVEVIRLALDRSLGEFRAAPDAATRLLKSGEAPVPPGLDPVTHAAWTTVCLSLLNLDESLSRE